MPGVRKYLIEMADMTSLRIRSDLAAVEIDGEVVVYEPTEPTCHILSGGAAIVWIELESSNTDHIVDRVCERVGLRPDEIEVEVLGVIDNLNELELLEPIPDLAVENPEKADGGTPIDPSHANRSGRTMPDPPAP